MNHYRRTVLGLLGLGLLVVGVGLGAVVAQLAILFPAVAGFVPVAVALALVGAVGLVTAAVAVRVETTTGGWYTADEVIGDAD